MSTVIDDDFTTDDDPELAARHLAELLAVTQDMGPAAYTSWLLPADLAAVTTLSVEQVDDALDLLHLVYAGCRRLPYSSRTQLVPDGVDAFWTARLEAGIAR